MKYQELEFIAACAVGTTAATICALFEYIYGYGVIEIGFSAICLFVIGAGLFVAIADRVSDDREKRERRRHKMKQIDFRVGRMVPGSDYVEVKN
jgi:hypothetical protein